jgi:glutamine synthetase
MRCSLLDDSGANAFDDGTGQGTDLLRHAIAGCLATMADSMLLFAPNLNSYRRFQRGYWPDALANFSGSEFIGQYLGSEFQRVYTLLKQQEMDEFDRLVTPLEYDACL